MIEKFLFPLLIACSTAACVPQTSAPDVSAAASTQTSAAWLGSYAGILPCASCSGIETTLTLNADGTYSIKELYQGEGKPFVTKGTYTLDKAGTKVTLIDKNDNGEHRSYKLGKGKITALDMSGNVITGNMAALYVLKKIK